MTHRNYDKFPFQLIYRLIILSWDIIDVVFRNGNVITFHLVRGGGDIHLHLHIQHTEVLDTFSGILHTLSQFYFRCLC